MARTARLRVPTSLSFALLVLAFLCAADSARAAFTITDLGTLGGATSFARGVNERGDVVGYSDSTGNTVIHAFVWTSGVMTDLGTLGGHSSYAYGINGMGSIVGSASTNPVDKRQRAFIYRGGVMTDLGALGGATSQALGINDLEEVVGSADTDPVFAYPHGFLWKNDVMTDLQTLGGHFSVAFDVSNASRVVGTGFLAGDANNHAFRWNTPGPMVDLGTLGGTRSAATAINNTNTVVGYANTAGGAEHAFVRAAAAATNTDLGTLGGTQSQAWSINNSGTIVGFSKLAGDAVTHAFISTGVGMTDLNTQLPPASGWVLTEARGISNGGLIVGVGDHNGATHAFLMTPSPLVGVDTPSPSLAFAGAYPNPTNGRAQLTFSVPARGSVELALFDLGGRRVKSLVDGELGAGSHVVAWDGTDETGARLGTGLYFARLRVAGRVLMSRITLIR